MKNFVSFAALSLAILGFASCSKQDNDDVNLNQTVNATIKQNETYQYDLPNPSSGSFGVESSGANSANTSVVSNTAGRTFIYTPPANYTGTDVVVVSNVAPPVTSNNSNNGGCGGHHNCGNGEHHGCGEHHGDNHGGCGERHHKKHDCGNENGERHGSHKITFNISVIKNEVTSVLKP